MKVNEHIEKIADKTKKASVSVGEALSDVCEVAKESAKTIAVAVFDQNGDGEVTKEDIRILSKRGANAGKKVAERTVKIIEEASKTELVKEAAAGALVGAAVAVPVPLIGPVAGAAIGASIGVYANVTRGKPNQGKIITKTVKRVGAEARKAISSSTKKTKAKG